MLDRDDILRMAQNAAHEFMTKYLEHRGGSMACLEYYFEIYERAFREVVETRRRLYLRGKDPSDYETA